MGSFANSLHVESDDAASVARALTELFVEAGWQPTEKKLDLSDTWGGEGSLRGVQISAPRDGWVSILDTDLAAAHAIVQRLAKRLATHAIFFFVDDSDSWSYLAADPKGRINDFESGDGADDEDGDGGEFAGATAAIAQLQDVMRDGSIVQKFQDMQAQMFASAPPEVREAHDRIKSGRPEPGDMQRYQAWLMQELPKHQMQFRSMISGLFHLPGVSKKARSKKKSRPKQSKKRQAAQQKWLDALRPLFAEGVTDEQVQEVLDKRDIFAENLLAEFLPLLGIAEFYANLSYRYLQGVEESELAAHNIRFVNDLRFEPNRPAQLSHS